jgi:hypothetical protein
MRTRIEDPNVSIFTLKLSVCPQSLSGYYYRGGIDLDAGSSYILLIIR